MQDGIARVFTSGNSQAVRLPKEFRLDVEKVFIHRSGDSLVLTPRMKSWEGFAEGLSGLSDDFAVDDELGVDTPRHTFE